jgi:hypothetical protein
LITSRTSRAERLTVMSEVQDTEPDIVVIRPAEPRDARSLARIAGRDSKLVPDGPLVVAEAGGEIVAAVALDGGATIADPFRPTAALVSLLELRAAQLRRSRSRHGGTLAAAGASAARIVRGTAWA